MRSACAMGLGDLHVRRPASSLQVGCTVGPVWAGMSWRTPVSSRVSPVDLSPLQQLLECLTVAVLHKLLCLHSQVLTLAHFHADLMPSCNCLQSLHVLAAPNWPRVAHSEALADSPPLIGAHRSKGDPLKENSSVWGPTSPAGTLPASVGRRAAEPALASQHSSQSAGKAWPQALVG